MQMFIAFLFVALVKSLYASSITINGNFLEKHLAELSNQPTRSAVFKLQTDIKKKHPQRTTNHIMFSSNLENLRIRFNNSVVQKCPNQIGIGNNRNCTVDSLLFADGIVWCTWPSLVAAEPDKCYYIRSCSITISLRGISNEIFHLFQIIESRDCKLSTKTELEDPPGVRPAISGSNSLQSNFLISIALVSIYVLTLMESSIG
ncbi:hypothetical protein DPMN_089993 [Dreissena polymorpha]|uniref:Uncharacterized protein n=1 Tax=Dreissena polymorpha TaxID=45954 RepID=A0A9D4KYW2_DREPO|nr:hypothetical protein DPMN_089993 [Dreissena polymorpha]